MGLEEDVCLEYCQKSPIVDFIFTPRLPHQYSPPEVHSFFLNFDPRVLGSSAFLEMHPTPLLPNTPLADRPPGEQMLDCNVG